MSIQEYRDIAFGGAILLVFLGLVWFNILRRFGGILKEHLKAAGSRQAAYDVPGVFVFLLRGDFERTGDERLAATCRRFRQTLYSYIGVVGAYFVFLFICRPHL